MLIYSFTNFKLSILESIFCIYSTFTRKRTVFKSWLCGCDLETSREISWEVSSRKRDNERKWPLTIHWWEVLHIVNRPPFINSRSAKHCATRHWDRYAWNTYPWIVYKWGQKKTQCGCEEMGRAAKVGRHGLRDLATLTHFQKAGSNGAVRSSIIVSSCQTQIFLLMSHLTLLSKYCSIAITTLRRRKKNFISPSPHNGSQFVKKNKSSS